MTDSEAIEAVTADVESRFRAAAALIREGLDAHAVAWRALRHGPEGRDCGLHLHGHRYSDVSLEIALGRILAHAGVDVTGLNVRFGNQHPD